MLSRAQELYWRIPASMTPQQLNAAARALRPSPVNVGAEAGEIARADGEMAGTSQSPVSSGDEQEASEDDLSDSDDNEEGVGRVYRGIKLFTHFTIPTLWMAFLLRKTCYSI